MSSSYLCKNTLIFGLNQPYKIKFQTLFVGFASRKLAGHQNRVTHQPRPSLHVPKRMSMTSFPVTETSTWWCPYPVMAAWKIMSTIQLLNRPHIMFIHIQAVNWKRILECSPKKVFKNYQNSIKNIHSDAQNLKFDKVSKWQIDNSSSVKNNYSMKWNLDKQILNLISFVAIQWKFNKLSFNLKKLRFSKLKDKK